MQFCLLSLMWRATIKIKIVVMCLKWLSVFLFPEISIIITWSIKYNCCLRLLFLLSSVHSWLIAGVLLSAVPAWLVLLSSHSLHFPSITSFKNIFLNLSVNLIFNTSLLNHISKTSFKLFVIYLLFVDQDC